MKKILSILIGICLISVPAYSANLWRAGSGENTILGTENVSDIDTVSFQRVVDPLDRLLSNYREDATLSYNSSSTIDIAAGEVVCSNSGGTIRRFRKNTSTTSLTFSDLDTGAEASSTTYYVYAVCDADATTFTGTISASSTAPTGDTYYVKLGSFFNDSSSNILNDETVTNDNNYYGLVLGDWVSRSIDTAYQASTDGFVVAYASGNTEYAIEGYTDNASSPTTLRIKDGDTALSSQTAYAGISFPVKKGDYWKVVSVSGVDSSSVYWIPNQ